MYTGILVLAIPPSGASKSAATLTAILHYMFDIQNTLNFFLIAPPMDINPMLIYLNNDMHKTTKDLQVECWKAIQKSHLFHFIDMAVKTFASNRLSWLDEIAAATVNVDHLATLLKLASTRLPSGQTLGYVQRCIKAWIAFKGKHGVSEEEKVKLFHVVMELKSGL
ncbi:hypothetical protein HDV00_001995 [Rhizophlyctis rosea]|nr:hypothetical protein HDV00_001995 [Rhizophlyctis rosea]